MGGKKEPGISEGRGSSYARLVERTDSGSRKPPCKGGESTSDTRVLKGDSRWFGTWLSAFQDNEEKRSAKRTSCKNKEEGIPSFLLGRTFGREFSPARHQIGEG